MQTNAKAMVLASFVADSLALGAHWIYDTATIDRQFGRVEHLLKPSEDSYHPSKGRGELTHYGDQARMLLDTLTGGAGFDLDQFSIAWREAFKTYGGYLDQATCETLENFRNGKGPLESGSTSAELGGAVRIGPLVYMYRGDPERLVKSVRAQTAMTHNHPDVIDSAEFLARTAVKVLQRTTPQAAVKAVAAEHFSREPFQGWVSHGISSAGLETRAAISNFGQMCDVGAAFPGVIHLLVRYENNLRAALVENVMAGGDSAARGMAVGMILGAYLGMASIPADWLADLKNRKAVLQALEQIDAIEIKNSIT